MHLEIKWIRYFSACDIRKQDNEIIITSSNQMVLYDCTLKVFISQKTLQYITSLTIMTIMTVMQI